MNVLIVSEESYLYWIVNATLGVTTLIELRRCCNMHWRDLKE